MVPRGARLPPEQLGSVAGAPCALFWTERAARPRLGRNQSPREVDCAEVCAEWTPARPTSSSALALTWGRPALLHVSVPITHKACSFPGWLLLFDTFPSLVCLSFAVWAESSRKVLPSTTPAPTVLPCGGPSQCGGAGPRVTLVCLPVAGERAFCEHVQCCVPPPASCSDTGASQHPGECTHPAHP